MKFLSLFGAILLFIFLFIFWPRQLSQSELLLKAPTPWAICDQNMKCYDIGNVTYMCDDYESQEECDKFVKDGAEYDAIYDAKHRKD